MKFKYIDKLYSYRGIFMIELVLAEDVPKIAKTGDSVILKDDGTFEIKKSDRRETPAEEGERAARQENYDKEEEKIEKLEDVRSTSEKPTKAWWDNCTADVKAKNPEYSQERIDKICGAAHFHKSMSYDPRIEKYLSIDKEKSWALLTKFYNDGHLDSYKVLKEFINKIAICPDVTEKFDKIMEDWMKSGEADVSSIEKIINSCKKEEGNVEKAERSPEQLRQMEEARRRQQQDDEDTKIKPIGKTGEILEEVLKNKPDRDTKWVDEMVASGELPKQRKRFPPKKTRMIEAPKVRDTQWD